jgi:hypothetical protein
MEFSIQLVLIEVSPFLTLPTLRAPARGPKTFRGGMEGSPSHGDRSQWLQTPTPDSNQPTAIYSLSSITRITCIETKPVENFGALEAIISMCQHQEWNPISTQAVA